MSKITTVGIDLAKNVFSLHGVDEHGAVVLQRTVTRARLLEVVAGLSPCLIGMEASMGAHHWAREFARFGHTARLMVSRFVAPYRKSGKNDGNDAAAICEAVSRPTMRFVPVKSQEQQAVLSLQRVRQGFVEERTATINRIRGLLLEFGVALPQRRRDSAHAHDDLRRDGGGWHHGRADARRHGLLQRAADVRRRGRSACLRRGPVAVLLSAALRPGRAAFA